MRITNKMMMNNYLDNLYGNLEKVDKLQAQVATGKRITKLSDDPVGAVSVMQCSVKLYKIDQYIENINSAQTWLQQTETSVLELNEVIKSAYETAVNVSSDYYSDDDLSAAAELIGQLRDHVVTIGNSQSGDKYIFGGYNLTNEPFSVDASGNVLYNDLDLANDSDAALIAEDKQSIAYEIGYDLNMKFSITGSKLLGMGQDNIYAVLDGLYNALVSGDTSQNISAYIGKLQDCQSHVLAIDAEIGGKVSRLELMSNRYEEDHLSYTELKSSIADVDEAKAAMNLKMANTVYEASLTIGSYIIQRSLVDFLK